MLYLTSSLILLIGTRKTSGHKENSRTQNGLCLEYWGVFLPNLSVSANYFAANALINSYIACDAAMPVIWA